MDPGCEFTPFEPNFDIRRYFTVSQIMMSEYLGPNGAILKASELIGKNAAVISIPINKLPGTIRLIDTPGQMEVFLFHGGEEIVRLLNGSSIALFLIDAGAGARSNGLLFTQLLGLAVSLRLGIQAVSIMNKIDLVEEMLPE
jgi:hypothetical protein